MTKQFFISILILKIFLFTACEQNPYKQGELLYIAKCANCHMEDGSGLESLYPPLAQADYLQNHLEKVPCYITNGLEGEIVVNGKTYNLKMEAIKGLNENEITNIMNYISHRWVSNPQYITVEDTKAYLKACE